MVTVRASYAAFLSYRVKVYACATYQGRVHNVLNEVRAAAAIILGPPGRQAREIACFTKSQVCAVSLDDLPVHQTVRRVCSHTKHLAPGCCGDTMSR